MTLAICWNCGTQKIGALTVCGHCGRAPTSSTDKAKSMLLSDHHQQQAELLAIGQRIAQGEPPRFDEAELEQLAAFLSIEDKPPLGCIIVTWIPIVVLVLLLIAVGVLLFSGAFSR